MKITVLGCGALGQLWLTALCKQGHEVQGWLRVPQPYCSVNLVETDGAIFNESLTANDPDFLATSDLLLVTLKHGRFPMPSKPRIHTACSYANTVNSQRHGHHRRIAKHSAAITDGHHHPCRPPRRQCHYSCGKRNHAYRSGTATGWRLQLSGGYFANRVA